MEKPEDPVIEDEVWSWFPHSRFYGQPQKGGAAIKRLTSEIERRRLWFQGSKEPELEAGARQLSAVGKLGKSLAYEIAQLRQVARSYTSGSEIKNLSDALDAFLRVAPGNAVGGQRKEEIIAASKLAPFVAKCLERPDKPLPSLTSADGPVVKVLIRAIERLFGTTISGTSLSDGLKEQRKRGSSPPA